MNPEVIKKAWTVHLPKEVSGYDEDASITVYADNAAKAKSMAYYEWELADNWSFRVVLGFRVVRCKSMDLCKNTGHELSHLLVDKCYYKIAHALGVDVGTLKQQPAYRNYYQTKFDADLETLIEPKLVEKYETASGLVYYYVTELGRKVFFSMRPNLRCDLNEN